MQRDLAARGESAAWHRDLAEPKPRSPRARREEGKYRKYLTHRGQRPAPPQVGCIGGRMQQDFHHGLLRLGLLAAACLAGLTGGAAAQAGSTGSAPFLVIRHATLLAGTTPFPGVDRALVVEGAAVRWVGADVDLRLPPDAATLDVGGRVVIPGLIDLHQHAASVSAAPSRWLSHGVTTVRDPGADLERARRTRAAIEAGRMAGPRLFVGLLLDLSAGQTRGSVRRDVAESAAAGIDLVNALHAHAGGPRAGRHPGGPRPRAPGDVASQRPAVPGSRLWRGRRRTPVHLWRVAARVVGVGAGHDGRRISPDLHTLGGSPGSIVRAGGAAPAAPRDDGHGLGRRRSCSAIAWRADSCR